MPELIGIQGSKGAFHEQAAWQMFGADAGIAYIPTFEELFAALRERQIRKAVTAIASLNVGFIDEPHEELVENGKDYWISGETYVPVKLQLLGPRGATLESVNEVHTMAPAWQQCTHTMHHLLPNAKRVEEEDTAASAELVRDMNDITHAAIASQRAGELNGLTVVRDNVQDMARNVTRFLALELREDKDSRIEGIEDKTTVLLDMPDKRGALFKALGPFWLTRINISTLHSSFVEDSDFNERFFMEFDAGIKERRTRLTMNLLRKLGCELTVLGSYERHPIPDRITREMETVAA